MAGCQDISEHLTRSGAESLLLACMWTTRLDLQACDCLCQFAEVSSAYFPEKTILLEL